MKKVVSILAALLAAALLSGVSAAAATLVTVETQYTYSVSNPTWLKDLIVKENMVSPSEIASSLKLKALPDYPYSKTPEGFRKEIDYYVSLYSLDENSQRAAYIYVLQYVNQFASEATKNVSDEYIKNYLTERGVTYPEGGLGDYENLIYARALYTLYASNAVRLNITPGVTVQAALIQCMTQIFGVDEAALAQWGVGTVDTLDEYVLIACKIALNAGGYKVTAATPAEEVYRLTAVMMVRQLGISIDENNASFDELKLKYLAALLGARYDVSLDPEDLRDALNRGEAPFYLLQIIGRNNGVTVRSGMGYSEAFTLVAENSDYFALEDGEFYADIYHYAVYLQYKRDRIWVSPAAYRTSTATETVLISIDGKSCGSGEYAEVTLDKADASQDVYITVSYYSASQNSSQTYRLTVHQGASEPPAQSGDTTPDSGSNSLIRIVGGNIVNTITNTMGNASAETPNRISNILSLMVPDLRGDAQTAAAPAAADGQDYLTQLLNGGSGTANAGTTGFSFSGAGQTGIGAGLSGVGGYNAVNGAGGNGTDFTADTGTASSMLAMDGEPMLLSEAGDPPEGYEYISNADGYITGVTMKRAASAAGSAGESRVTFRMVSRVLPFVAVPAAAATVCLIVLAVLRLKKRA